MRAHILNLSTSRQLYSDLLHHCYGYNKYKYSAFLLKLSTRNDTSVEYIHCSSDQHNNFTKLLFDPFATQQLTSFPGRKQVFSKLDNFVSKLLI